MMHQHESTTAAAARALVAQIFLLATGNQVTSILICDDRPAAAQDLSRLLQPLPMLADSICVHDPFALADCYARRAVDLVVIGVHSGSRLGQDAIGLTLGLNPTAVIIVVGAARDADALAAVFVRGARGLVVWEPDQASSPAGENGGPLVW